MAETVATSKLRISVYLPSELKEQLELIAKARKRSLSNLIEVAMEKVVQDAKDAEEI